MQAVMRGKRGSRHVRQMEEERWTWDSAYFLLPATHMGERVFSLQFNLAAIVFPEVCLLGDPKLQKVDNIKHHKMVPEKKGFDRFAL